MTGISIKSDIGKAIGNRWKWYTMRFVRWVNSALISNTNSIRRSMQCNSEGHDNDCSANAMTGRKQNAEQKNSNVRHGLVNDDDDIKCLIHDIINVVLLHENSIRKQIFIFIINDTSNLMTFQHSPLCFRVFCSCFWRFNWWWCVSD